MIAAWLSSADFSRSPYFPARIIQMVILVRPNDSAMATVRQALMSFLRMH
jgi:hypothetical protein